MTHQINISEARVYVGTYGKYTGGSIAGEWLQLSHYTDKGEFYEACKELHDDEEDPEFMFQDYENIPGGMIGEFWIREEIFAVIEAMENMEKSHIEPFQIWCRNGNRNLSEEDIDDLINGFERDYVGEYDSEEDFAWELAQENEELTEFAKRYFDYDAYAHDLFCGEYWSENGHVFYNA